ncbi:MAG TPA: hypothetical protein DD420_26245 [Streptomyces sp.]|nr:hypothetical protein [Streptomyces sp.]
MRGQLPSRTRQFRQRLIEVLSRCRAGPVGRRSRVRVNGTIPGLAHAPDDLVELLRRAGGPRRERRRAVRSRRVVGRGRTSGHRPLASR